MPIRTNRGRTAVYRRLWGWPLRSPRHLVGTLVILAVVLTAVGIMLPKAIEKPGQTAGRPGSSATSTSRPGVAAPVTVTSTLPPRLTTQPPPSSARPDQDGVRVAKEWVTAWANHPDGITAEQWLSGLKPYTTEEFLSGELTTVNPANIPATKIIGEPQVSSSVVGSMDVDVQTDGPKVRVTVVKTNPGWRVTKFTQAS
ncbi:hypothetical protein [Amycolatopsis regifaucium]|uniref:Uncharacterized protein n=1 Tax=Amycolatopsis regifaucium TaxID=546365 RepID=A0A154MD01_9PSEU|nr:hypothetical protein [Amycolatopsis regifaucium]KZB82468.1 hypothetical protein AVL48_11255 [Amycolatopsis regifaucium]OKA03411.1 hypothetical protein ATP06_0236445 [Amycolatopsis regifaucium]SFJ43037.1 hypothetical protein SAMN04489731_12133 [Amycolatopsis regifaucium]